MLNVTQDSFRQAAKEIGQSGENDTLPYDRDAAFIRDQAEELSQICIEFFQAMHKMSKKDMLGVLGSISIGSERLLVPVGSHGFRITTKIHSFWISLSDVLTGL